MIIFTVKNENSARNLAYFQNGSYFLKYPCESESNSKCVPYEADFPPGVYMVECYGASGGNAKVYNSQNNGGKGGYSIGLLKLKHKTHIWIYIGGKGSENFGVIKATVKGGYNGGGNGGYDTSNNNRGSAGGGGGATDIRINVNDLDHRIIVAAGGGGASTTEIKSSQSFPTYGGNGGGLTGQSTSNTNTYGKGATGATQEQGGIAFTARGATHGVRGFGGTGSSAFSAWPGGGGGGGYFGGGGGSSSVDHPCGWAGAGSGGSSYIGGVEKGQTYSGSSKFGNVGNGFAVITDLWHPSYFRRYNRNRFISFINNILLWVEFSS